MFMFPDPSNGRAVSFSPVNDIDETEIAPIPNDIFVLEPRGLGLGEDRIIGGASGPAFRVIDLSKLSHPVTVHWSGRDSGWITDGADSLVFQGVEEIVLPACMREGLAA